MKMAVSRQPRLLLEDVSKGSVALLMSSIPHVLKAAAVPAECPLGQSYACLCDRSDSNNILVVCSSSKRGGLVMYFLN